MSSVKVSGSATGTANFTIIAPSGTSTDRTLTLPDEAGTVLTSASDITSQARTGVPVFSAYAQNTDQVISNDTWTKVQLPSEDVDSNGTFNTTTYTWTPDVAGWYLVSAKLKYKHGSNGSTAAISVRKNGSYYSIESINLTSNYFISGAISIAPILVHMNGTTDYLDLYALLVGSGTLYLSDDANYWGNSFMNGFLVRAD
jgi:hypothetical protein